LAGEFELFTKPSNADFYEFITFDELVKNITDGEVVRRGPYTPAKKQRDKKAQRFFRDEAIQVVCRVSEKLLQRGRWDFLRRHHF
ncbi:MAG: hypothetical protein GY797_09565, partial [Deltaproteobacteria bacterium]|nr:hypothetical protein [Deltaproteobacteria bacterium]